MRDDRSTKRIRISVDVARAVRLAAPGRTGRGVQASVEDRRGRAEISFARPIVPPIFRSSNAVSMNGGGNYDGESRGNKEMETASGKDRCASMFGEYRCSLKAGHSK